MQQRRLRIGSRFWTTVAMAGAPWLGGALAAVSAQAAHAATWRVVSAHTSGPFHAGLDWTFGGSLFADGQYNAFTGQLASTERVMAVLDAQGQPLYSAAFNDWSDLGAYGYMRPPQVDLTLLQAEFSALVLIAWAAGGVPGIGWEIGRPGWVPLTAHADGSYSAQWTSEPPLSIVPKEPTVVSLRFSAVVPEPPMAGLLGLAGGLLLWQRRRARTGLSAPRLERTAARR